MPDQGGQALHVLASAARQEAEAIAGAVARSADADVIEVRQPETVDCKAASADLARDFLEDVKIRPALLGKREHADAVATGTPDQADVARRWFVGIGHGRPRIGSARGGRPLNSTRQTRKSKDTSLFRWNRGGAMLEFPFL